MVLPKTGGMARKVYLVTTAMITLLTVIFGYLYIEQQREKLVQERVNQLIIIAAALEQQVSRYEFDALANSAQETEGNASEKVLMLVGRYQPVLDKVQAEYPGYKIGLFSRVLNRIVAMSPAEDVAAAESYTDPGWEVYKSGKVAVQQEVSSPGWQGKTALNVQYPVFAYGRVVGHTWASVSLEEVEGEVAVTIRNVVWLTVVIWGLSMAAISLAFVRLGEASAGLAEQIRSNGEDVDSVKDFPELLPVLTTIAELKRKYANEANMLAQVIDACPVGIVFYDKDGYAVRANPIAEKACQKGDETDINGHPLRIMAYFSDQSSVFRALKGEEPKERRVSVADREWLVKSVPLLEHDNEAVAGFITSMQDITEYELLRSEMHKLDRANLVSSMAAGVAHEIRNPLTVIKGYLQFMKAKADKKGQEYYKIVFDELERVETIIADFLSLAGNKSTEKKIQNLNDVIQNMYPLIYADAVKRGVTVELDLDACLPDLNIDSGEIRQLLLNLIRNGIEAVDKAEGRILISTGRQGNDVKLSVADNGRGIAEKDIEKIFDPFYSSKENGTGLGLAISSSIVHRHHGSIAVDSKEGNGAVFVVKIPIPAGAA